MKRLPTAVAAIIIQATVLADGGTVQLRREAGDFVITVFTLPAPLSVGRADISVLVQTRTGLDSVLDAQVRLALRSETSPVEFEARPTRVNAQNKLLYAAPVMFSKPGKWRMEVEVSRNGKETGARGTLDVIPAGPGLVSYAGYFAFPPVVVGLFAIRERLIHKRSMRIYGSNTTD